MQFTTFAVMLDSLEIYSISFSEDTLQSNADSVIVENIITTFFQNDAANIVVRELERNQFYDIVSYVLVGLLVIAAFIWYLFPDRMLAIFNIGRSRRNYSEYEIQKNVPGTFIIGYFWVVTVIALSFFLFEVLKIFFPETVALNNDLILILKILLLVVGFILFRVLLEYTTAFIFNTFNLLELQFDFAGKIHLTSGILLLPALLLLIYVKTKLVIIILLILFALTQVFRIGILIRVGKSSPMFSALHIILYLCTLEIVPVMVLIRLIKTGFLL